MGVKLIDNILKKLKSVGPYLIIGMFVGMQTAPVERTNPRIRADLIAPQEIKDILTRACYDCHSNETNWPLYSNVAPASWFIAGHVNEARGHLNFSNWETQTEARKVRKLEQIDEWVSDGRMPLPSYLILNGDSELSNNDITTLKKWVKDSLPSVVDEEKKGSGKW